MTEDQLALEREDPTAVIPWPEHWKKVSLRPQENGYTRTPNACSAYWLEVGYDFSVDNYEPSPEMPRFRKTDDAKEEVEDELMGDDVDEEIERLENEPEGEGQVEVEVESDDDDVEYAAIVETAGPEEKTSKPNQASVDDSASTYSRDEELIPEELPEPKNILLSNANSISTPSTTPAPSEKDPSEDESYQSRQRESTKSKMSQTPTRAEVTPQKSRSPKVSLRRGFRFNAEQRAILEAQVANFGPYPDTDRRYELAGELDVEEKTVKNWFIHRRSQKGQTNLSGMTTPGQINPEDSFASEGSNPASAPPDSSFKRGPSIIDFKENSVPVVEDLVVHQAKRPRLENDYSFGHHQAPRMTPIIVPSNAPIDEFASQRGFGMRQSSGSSISLDASRNSSMAASVSRESAANSISSFSPVNLTQARHHPNGGLAPQRHSHELQEEHRPEIKKSPSFPTLVSGSDWNPINSARSRDSKPMSIASVASTPTPILHTLPSHHGHLINHRSFSKPVSVSPQPNADPSRSPFPPLPQQQQQQQQHQHHLASASPPPKPNPSTNESEEKQWMTSKVSSFQLEISNLKHDNAARLHRLSLIDQRINEMSNEENAVEEEKQKDMMEAMRQIEASYRGRSDFLKAQQRELGQSRDVELEGLERNGLDLKKRETALEHFQALVGLYDEE